MGLRCFVAMAFDNTDTDEWFDHALTPLLREIGSSIRRVDRIEHNDDIDDRIVAEIEAADFVIADLTYARPSVYFEAGYAQRSIPVIYTVRSDHFRRTEDPNRSHLRVHFDLTMRNIVAWASPDDKAFEKRMRRRLQLVTAPMRKEIEDKRLRQQEAATFAAVPVVDKLSLAMGMLRSCVARDGLIRLDPPANPDRVSVGVTTGCALRGGSLIGLQASVTESVTVSGLKGLLKEQLAYPRYNIQLPRLSDRLERLVDIYFMLSLRAVPLSRIASGLPVLGVVDDRAKHLRWIGDESLPKQRIKGYDRVTKARGWDGVFDAYKANGTSDRLVVKSGVVASTRGVNVPAVEVEEFPRVLDVVVIDRIESERDVNQRVKDALERWRGALLT